MPSQAYVENAKQAVKTAVAGVISLGFTNFFHLPEGYWAAISALIVMQSNVGATLTASRTRLAGTAVGAIVGGLFVALFGSNILGFALAVAIAFFVCTTLRLAESQRLATVTVAIIMLTDRTNSVWLVAVHRFSEVALGIVIALVVSLTLWPSHARRTVRKGLADTLSKLAAFYRAVMRNYRAGDSDSIQALKAEVSAALRKNSSLLQNALEEAFGPLKEREALALLVQQVDRVFRAVEALESAVRDSSTDTYFRSFDHDLEQLENGIASALASLSGGIATGTAGAPGPDLGAIVSSLESQAAAERTAGATMNYSLDEILRFYYLLLSSRNLAGEVELMRSLAEIRLHAKSG